MLPYRDNRLTGLLLSLFLVAILAYGYYEARGILYGPVIDIPTEQTLSHDPLVRIHGTARSIASLSMNGAPVPVGENGSFDEPYLLAPGYNKVQLSARDKYGTQATRVLEIMYEPLSVEPATTTPR